MYHQNPKLQISVIPVIEINYKILIKTSVCEIENWDFMMYLCKLCSRETGVKNTS